MHPSHFDTLVQAVEQLARVVALAELSRRESEGNVGAMNCAKEYKRKKQLHDFVEKGEL